MIQLDLVDGLTIIAFLSLIALAYLFRSKIRTLDDHLKKWMKTKMGVSFGLKRSECCILLCWIIFLNFFVWFIFSLLGVVIIYWMIFKNPILPDFFQNYNLTIMLKSVQNPAPVQIFFANDFSSFILLIGIFISYCYFFDHIRSIGRNLNKFSSEKSHLSSPFIYLFFICVFITVVFIGSAIEGYFHLINLNKILEILTLILVLSLALINVIIFKRTYGLNQLTFKKFESISLFLKKERFDIFYNSFSRMIFFITLEIPIFGYIFGFNPLSIISIDVILIFMMWVLGIFNQHPINSSTIQLSCERSISRVYIIDTDNDFIQYITNTDKIEKISINMVQKIKQDQITSLDKFLQSGAVSPLHYKKFCNYVSKIGDEIVFLAMTITLFLGVSFNLLYALILNFSQSQWSLVLYAIIIFSFIDLVVLILLVYVTHKLITKDPTLNNSHHATP